MNMRNRLMASAVAIGAALLPMAARAQSPSCARACLTALADKLVASMVAHDPASLPLASEYAATENSVPAALSMMTIWRTATAASNKHYVIDPVSGQLFLLATVSEGPRAALLFGRIKVRDRKIAEIELYTDRSRSDGGFQFNAAGLSRLPPAWTRPVAPARRPSRSALLEAGRSIFDASVASPPAAPGCVLMENGKVVAEDPEVLKAVMPQGAEAPPMQRNPDGTVAIPCGMPPDRPTDKEARTDIVDEEQGIVISIGTVHGIVQPYVITKPTESAFVPHAMLAPYADMLAKQQGSGKYRLPALRPMPASITVAQMHRIYDGKIQGMHLLEKLGPPGAHGPWSSASSKD